MGNWCLSLELMSYCDNTTSAQAKELQSFNSYKTFEEVNNIKIPYEIVDRIPGDLATVFADASKAGRELEQYRCQAVRQDKGVSYSGWDSH